MHELWIVPTANMTFSTILQNHANMIVDNTNIQSCGCCVVALLFSCNMFVPTSGHLLLFWTSGLSKYTEMSVCFLIPSHQAMGEASNQNTWESKFKGLVQARVDIHFGSLIKVEESL